MDSRLNHAVAVAHSGTFTAAAKKVGVTQSAITRSIADLEREIGYPIFVRTGRGAILTEQGRDFVERAQKILEDAKELLLRPRGNDDQYSGVLHVGVCPASIEFLLMDPVEELLRRYPAIKVNIFGTTFERTVQQLRSGAVDLAVGFEAAFADWPDLRRHDILFETQGVLFVRRGHPLTRVPNPSARDLSQYDFVSPSDSRPYGATLRSLFEDQNIDWRKKLHIVDFFPMVKRIVASSDAVGVVFRRFVEKSSSFREEFETISSDVLPLESGAMCCAHRSRWEIRPPVRAFISILRNSKI